MIVPNSTNESLAHVDCSAQIHAHNAFKLLGLNVHNVGHTCDTRAVYQTVQRAKPGAGLARQRQGCDLIAYIGDRWHNPRAVVEFRDDLMDSGLSHVDSNDICAFSIEPSYACGSDAASCAGYNYSPAVKSMHVFLLRAAFLRRI
ncbi:hypothetical protein L901_19315 [Agrobacterium sp. D14]|nr:hypothetical protein L901_19315 [Agrobacterium sp. D14]